MFVMIPIFNGMLFGPSRQHRVASRRSVLRTNDLRIKRWETSAKLFRAKRLYFETALRHKATSHQRPSSTNGSPFVSQARIQVHQLTEPAIVASVGDGKQYKTQPVHGW